MTTRGAHLQEKRKNKASAIAEDSEAKRQRSEGHNEPLLVEDLLSKMSVSDPQSRPPVDFRRGTQCGDLAPWVRESLSTASEGDDFVIRLCEMLGMAEIDLRPVLNSIPEYKANEKLTRDGFLTVFDGMVSRLQGAISDVFVFYLRLLQWHERGYDLLPSVNYLGKKAKTTTARKEQARIIKWAREDQWYLRAYEFFVHVNFPDPVSTTAKGIFAELEKEFSLIHSPLVALLKNAFEYRDGQIYGIQTAILTVARIHPVLGEVIVLLANRLRRNYVPPAYAALRNNEPLQLIYKTLCVANGPYVDWQYYPADVWLQFTSSFVSEHQFDRIDWGTVTGTRLIIRDVLGSDTFDHSGSGADHLVDLHPLHTLFVGSIEMNEVLYSMGKWKTPVNFSDQYWLETASPENPEVINKRHRDTRFMAYYRWAERVNGGRLFRPDDLHRVSGIPENSDSEVIRQLRMAFARTDLTTGKRVPVSKEENEAFMKFLGFLVLEHPEDSLYHFVNDKSPRFFPPDERFGLSTGGPAAHKSLLYHPTGFMWQVVLLHLERRFRSDYQLVRLVVNVLSDTTSFRMKAGITGTRARFMRILIASNENIQGDILSSLYGVSRYDEVSRLNIKRFIKYLQDYLPEQSSQSAVTTRDAFLVKFLRITQMKELPH